MRTILEILMDRDGMSRDEAKDFIDEARQRVRDGEDPEDILHDDFGLEPDYVFELL